ncbi:ABC-type transport system periplasmic substrate-binding protein [Natrialba magadii ATCC 43099]|uniref:ABC-type transport system periplasmic substrate-binding protein n=1 Tax=Natrialba magadii (strain ATCC 43099 / DSM 3394 / CCM 3739 / CIP 104546 / IAM 13178 / JCM 8861 / NBRC 102185 / NCIMB 2190 / MS3) TaxID=547559 RepID=D3SXG4_NATMM|nr:ABC transporter substrate-binding protein [Natrialba magadii]ADD05913.1 ABC-type transport system periplasmic substrate-binding protein [Natrialba magadii ATCC 43099]ELY30580.1 nitrate/sulfonate/bicarbonate ABC transporter substrate-binding protein [Natrialba magadii ATCC 43099]
MAQSDTRDEIRVFHLPFSFMLPQRVAAEWGYFEAEGLTVDLFERDRRQVDWKYVPADWTLTGDDDVDLYPVCKWESLRRTWSLDDGTIVAHGAFADLPYTLYTRPETDIESPTDLAGVPVGVNRRTGQEYTAVKALEEHLEPEEIELAHHGMPTDRLQALRDGEVDAVTLLDPHSTLAEHLGFQRLLEFENHIGVVAGDSLAEDDLDAFMRAYERAVDAINDDPQSFRDEYLAMLESDAEVAPDLFADVDLEAIRESVRVPEYEVPEFAEPSELDGELEWMKDRELIDSEAEIGTIVAPSKQ